MRNFTGYFFEASKFGGLTRKPWTLSPCAPVNQKDSSGDIATCGEDSIVQMCRQAIGADEHSWSAMLLSERGLVDLGWELRSTFA